MANQKTEEKPRGRGRPPAMKSPNELDDAVDRYQLHCKENEEPFTIIGLAVFMGVTKETLNQYSKKPNYSDSYKKAMALAEKALVNGAMVGKYNPTISIFMLKNNHGYRDVKAVEHTGEGGKPIEQTITEVKLTKDEMIAEAKRRGIPLDAIGL